MGKKPYWKGFMTGIVVMGLCFGAVSFLPGIIRRRQTAALTMEQKLSTIAGLLDKHYVDTIDYNKMLDGVYAGLVDSLGDPYTIYMSKAQLDSFLQDTDGSFHGIGVEVMGDKNGRGLYVVTPIPDTPAARAGILPGDRIVKVNGTPVDGTDLQAAVTMMQGPEKTKVTITIHRDSTDEDLDFEIIREKISRDSITYEMLPEEIGYIKIKQFNKNTYEQFSKAYQDLTAQGQKGLIIDVRNNPGGLFDVVGKITDTLVPEGIMVYTIDKEGTRKDSYSDATCIQVPLVLLVNGNSASASEILAGAVQDMGVGKLVGTQTFGKGLVQGIYTLKDGSGVKITIQKYYTPKGVCIQGEGITPDYVVELPDSVNSLQMTRDEDIQLNEAISVIQGEWK